jgi:hypothetical protein
MSQQVSKSEFLEWADLYGWLLLKESPYQNTGHTAYSFLTPNGTLALVIVSIDGLVNEVRIAAST